MCTCWSSSPDWVQSTSCPGMDQKTFSFLLSASWPRAGQNREEFSTRTCWVSGASSGVCSGGKSFLWVRSLDHSSGLPEGAKILSEVRPTQRSRSQRSHQKEVRKTRSMQSSCMKQNYFIESVVIIQGLVQLFASLRNLFWYSKWISMALFNDIWYLPNPVIFFKSPFFCKVTMTEFWACTWV